MELRSYFKTVLKWWWLVLLAVVIAAGASYYASSRATPEYRSKATLMVGKTIQNPEPNTAEFYAGQQLANTYVQMVLREPVLKAVVSSLGWDMDWQALTEKITANIVANTELIEIFASDSNPLTAKAIVDAVAQQLIKLSPSGSNLLNQEQAAFIQSQLTDLDNKITDAQKEVERLKTELDATNSARQIQDLQDQINVQETKITGWQGTYATLLKSLAGGDVNALSIVEEGNVPTVPFFPNTSRNVLLAAAVGLVLAVGGIFAIEYLDDTVRAIDDTQALVNLPTLARIGRIVGDKENKLVALKAPLSPEADNFRMLRINLEPISSWQSLQTILFTSAEPLVGKSVTISNLAVVMAQSGKRVILVDCDFRKPSIHKLFGTPMEIGLKDLIVKSNLDVHSCLKPTDIENLKILPGGLERISSIEALGSERMKIIIKELTSLSDIVLFDGPPALMFSDPFIIGKLVSGVVIVSRVGKTRTQMLKRVVNEFRQGGINMLGVVIQVRQSGELYGSHYHRYYVEAVKQQEQADQLLQNQGGEEDLAIARLREKEYKKKKSIFGKHRLDNL